jgi:hypothetical protein
MITSGQRRAPARDDGRWRKSGSIARARPLQLLARNATARMAGVGLVLPWRSHGASLTARSQKRTLVERLKTAISTRLSTSASGGDRDEFAADLAVNFGPKRKVGLNAELASSAFDFRRRLCGCRQITVRGSGRHADVTPRFVASPDGEIANGRWLASEFLEPAKHDHPRPHRAFRKQGCGGFEQASRPEAEEYVLVSGAICGRLQAVKR